MAFAILQDGKFFRIAKNQSDVDDINIPEQFKTVVDISDDNFNSYVTNQKIISVDDGNVVFTDEPETSPELNDADTLKNYFNIFKEQANLYINNNSERQLAVKIKEYVNYLDTVDTSSVSYPINWEKYCSENSIAFFHKDQIG
tara:strand:+ start:839 stop:1267 length:429 start_codon:yes stop_codon:yes gene_type:complete